MVKIPQLKKKISSFLTKEDGKISKENLIKAGILLGSVALLSIKNVSADCPIDTSPNHDDHCNTSTPHSSSLSLRYAHPTATGSHNDAPGVHNDSHGNHVSHVSHGSY